MGGGHTSLLQPFCSWINLHTGSNCSNLLNAKQLFRTARFCSTRTCFLYMQTFSDMQRAREPDTGKITKSKLPKYILTFPIIEVRRGHHQILSFFELLPCSLQNPQLSTSGSNKCTVPIFSRLQKPKSVHSGEFVEPRDFFLRISFRIFFLYKYG